MKLVEDRFWSKVDKSGECWVWTAGTSKYGYGVFRLGMSTMLAHRVSMLYKLGFLPGSQLVCHHCDNPPCVRPEHLFLGTHQDNCDDKHAKGRNPLGPRNIGEDNAGHKLSYEQVTEIRMRLSGGETVADISKEFGLHKQSIYNIKNGKSWSRS